MFPSVGASEAISIQSLGISSSHPHDLLLACYCESYSSKREEKKCCCFECEPSLMWLNDLPMMSRVMQDIRTWLNVPPHLLRYATFRVLNNSFPLVWLYMFNLCLLIKLRIFIFAATSNETGGSVDWIHWCNWSKNKEGILVTLCMLYWSHWCAPCLVAFNVLHLINILLHMQEALLNSLPKLVALMSSSTEG